MSDIIMIRTFEHDRSSVSRPRSRVPVINGLTNEYHPCQIWPTSSPISSSVVRSRARRWRGSVTRTNVQYVAAGGRNARLQDARVDPAGLRGGASAPVCAAPGIFKQFANPMDAAKGPIS
jgi:ornithine carbamoyltransferase